jgi:protein required for attachment to host cells
MMSELANFLLPNEPTCVVACSAANARFWLSKSRFGDWKMLKEMHNELASSRDSELASDRPGRSFDIVGKGRHAMSSSVSPQEQESLRFARSVATYLNSAIANSDFENLVLLAAPGFLGQLRTELSDTALRAIVIAEPTNLDDLEEPQIREYFE